MPSFLLQYRLHCWQRSYPSMAPRMKSSSAVSWFKGRMMMCRMASIHSSLSRILHSRPSHQVFRIYLTPSRSVTDNAPSFVASNRSAGTVPRSSRCFRTCSCRRSCSSRPVYSLKIRQPCCVSHRIAPLPFRVRNTSISYCSSSATALSFTYNPS